VIGEKEVEGLVEAELAIVQHDAWGPVPSFKAYVLRNAVRVQTR
jgi:hypothetical protein